MLAVPHKPNFVFSDFTHIFVTSDEAHVHSTSVKMTADHYIPSGVCGANPKSFRDTKASDVEVGTCVLTVSGMSRVTSVSTERAQGLYTVVTGEELIVVNGIVVSPFAVSHVLAQSYYSLFRCVHRLAPTLYLSVSSWLANIQSNFADTVVNLSA